MIAGGLARLEFGKDKRYLAALALAPLEIIMSHSHQIPAAAAPRKLLACVLAVLALAFSASAFADSSDAHIPPPQDIAYPGTIQLHVDATNIAQGIFQAQEIIPVKPGKLTLFYPKWMPGGHAPTDSIDMLAGLKITANGTRIPWTRNEFDVFAFQIDVPQGVPSITVSLQSLSGPGGSPFITMTDKMLDLDWNMLSLYPAGYYTRRITIAPSVTLPQGWQYATGLDTESQSGGVVKFQPTSYNTLVDSPLYAGMYFKRIDLDPGAKVPVHLDLIADSPRYLAITPEQIQLHRNVVTQAYRLFGSHHYRHYDWLMALSKQLNPDAHEHHQSVGGSWPADYFSNWSANVPNRDIFAHEYVHSWDGKFRRPADLWTPNFNVPMGDSLLWVYEGQTQYWGFVLTARAGIWTPEQFRGALAMVAANYERNRPGLAWRTLADTTNDPVSARRALLPYRSWQLSEDYYSGGQLMWLAADAKIRALTHDQKSLDSFAKDFYGMDNSSTVTKTYTFNDVVNALNGVVKYDWAGFLKRNVYELNPPLASEIEAAGWKLVYTDTENEYEKDYEAAPQSPRHIFNFAWSIGLTLNRDGSINDVRWNGPAFEAHIGSGGKLLAVNGRAYTSQVLKDAITAAKASKAPIELLIRRFGEAHTFAVNYHGGLQYPHLVRIPGTPDYLDQIIAAKK